MRTLVPLTAAFAAVAALAGPALSGPPTTHPADAPAAVLVLQGRVTDGETGRPLQGAQVALPGRSAGALTDAAGRYVLRLPDALAGADVEVRVDLVGYRTLRSTVTLGREGATRDFALEATPLALEELVVTGARGETRAGEAAADATLRAAPSIAPPGARPPMPGTPVLQRSATDVVRSDPHFRGGDGFEREGYAHLVDNPFLAAASNPLSTFSIDVDRASYANVRRFLNAGARPPADAVRIEELVNYFPWDYAEPEGEHPFAVHTEVAPAPWRREHRLVKIGLQGRSVALEDIPPSNLVFLLDVSGSMGSHDKLPLLKQGFRMLVGELRPQDRVAIVVYAGAAGLVLPSTPGSDRRAILGALDRLQAGGSTAGGAGIRLAYEVARENFVEGGNNRVILATDGDFNVGASSDAEMIRLVEEKREEGTFLTVLGFGTGNLQDAKMEQIADHGNGNFFYIDGEREARKALVSEMAGTLYAIAKDVKLQVEFNPAKVRGYRLIGYENRMLAAEDFDDDRKDAGELGAGHSVTALYEVVPVDSRSEIEIRGLEPLRYRTPSSVTPEAAAGDELAFVKLRYKQPDGDESVLLTHAVEDRFDQPSDDFLFASAVAAFGMILRDSEHCGDFDLDDVYALARAGVGEDLEGYRQEFLGLVDLARRSELVARR